MQHFTLYLMAALYILAGVNHFKSPRFYLKMMPPYIPQHNLMNQLSGLAEIILGLGLLFENTRSLAAYGIIALLIAIFPANLYMLTSGKFHRVARWVLWLRLPLQLVLIWWAYQYV